MCDALFNLLAEYEKLVKCHSNLYGRELIQYLSIIKSIDQPYYSFLNIATNKDVIIKTRYVTHYNQWMCLYIDMLSSLNKLLMI